MPADGQDERERLEVYSRVASIDMKPANVAVFLCVLAHMRTLMCIKLCRTSSDPQRPSKLQRVSPASEATTIATAPIKHCAIGRPEQGTMKLWAINQGA